MSDKVQDLAEKLLWVDGPQWSKKVSFEHILRAALEPLLKAAEAITQIDRSDSFISSRVSKLAAELQNWTARNPDGR